MFRLLRPDVDAKLLHYLDCARVDTLRLRTSRVDLETVARERAQQPLRHLAATGIAGAKEENFFSARRCLGHGDGRQSVGDGLLLRWLFSSESARRATELLGKRSTTD